MKVGTLPPLDAHSPDIPLATLSPVPNILAQSATTQSVLLWVAIALVVTAVGLLIGVAISVYRRSRSIDIAELPQPMPTGAVPEAERLLRLMGEAEELAGRLTAQLDEKARHLEHLLRQADARAITLERRPPTPPTTSAPSSPAYAQTPAASPDPRVITRPINLATTIHAPSPVAALTGAPPAQHAASSQSASRPTPTPQPVSSAVDGASDPIVAAICRLADQGHATTDIAQQLNQPIGKVELILALRQA